jgi:hypothetical protein
MTKETKNFIIIILLVLTLIQGVFFYYFTEGFIKLLLLTPFAFIGLCFTAFILFKLIKYRSTTTPYHVIGFVLICVLAVSTIRGDLVEYLDFKLRKSERNEIVDEVKKGMFKSGHLSYDPFFPISKGGDIGIKNYNNGIVSIEFYIDRGFIDHYSAFLYTNDPKEIYDLEHGLTAFKVSLKKLDNNWYRVGY